MIGLDTNVLVRYLVGDNLAQAQIASRLIKAASREGETFFVNQVVLCELVWVLESAYGYSKGEIVGVLEKILLTEQVSIEDRDSAWAALNLYRKARGDFSDYLIGAANRNSGCSRTVTFDRLLRDEPTFELLV